EVSGADLMDGTPIYDIKPYVTYADSHPAARSGFVDEEEWKPLDVVLAPGVEASGADLSAIKEVLALDPRPGYHDDPSKVYGMSFGGYDVRFAVDGTTLTIIEVKVSN
ncbi:MAG: SAM-dependent methyltransferase, partial [Bacteroidales bacterium]|nr:SAM-dependent methyltransferase [Bacteroidales bacterium]